VFCQYVLSSGKDSIVRLWELSTCRSLIAYTGAGVTGKQEHRTQAIFNHTEDYGTARLVSVTHILYTLYLLESLMILLIIGNVCYCLTMLYVML